MQLLAPGRPLEPSARYRRTARTALGPPLPSDMASITAAVVWRIYAVDFCCCRLPSAYHVWIQKRTFIQTFSICKVFVGLVPNDNRDRGDPLPPQRQVSTGTTLAWNDHRPLYPRRPLCPLRPRRPATVLDHRRPDFIAILEVINPRNILNEKEGRTVWMWFG